MKLFKKDNNPKDNFGEGVEYAKSDYEMLKNYIDSIGEQNNHKYNALNRRLTKVEKELTTMRTKPQTKRSKTSKTEDK